MQAIILAAGMGKRLKHLTKNNTKCMVPVNGVTLIDLLREIKGSIIAFHCYQKGNDVKVSFRSKDEHYPVLPVAAKFGGGGHLMAAGLTVCNAAMEDVCAEIKDTLVRYLNGKSWD